MTRKRSFVTIHLVLAGIAHLVERHLAKVEVASSSLVARSKRKSPSDRMGISFCAEAPVNSLPPPEAREARNKIRGEAGFLLMAGGHQRDAGKRVRASLLAPQKVLIRKGGDFFCAGKHEKSVSSPGDTGIFSKFTVCLYTIPGRIGIMMSDLLSKGGEIP